MLELLSVNPFIKWPAVFIGGPAFLYFLYKKPDLIGILLFSLAISNINIEAGFLPLGFRATITIMLFIRIMGEIHSSPQPPFFSNGMVVYLVLFIVWLGVTSHINGLLDMGLFKEFFLDILAVFLGYYYFFKQKSHYVLKTAMILGGFSCLADLVYTYGIYGTFPVVRIFQVYTGNFSYNNHNYFGYVCGTCFIFLLSDYINTTDKKAAKTAVWVMPFMFLGVLLSTSRGALLAMIVVAVVLIGKALLSKNKGKKASTIITLTFVCLVITVFIFQIAASLGIGADFMTTITGRLVDEPLAMINKAMGNEYNYQSMDSMEWREEASDLAYEYYMSLPIDEQLFGIGYYGFQARDVGSGFDAHNGILLLITETGFFGFVMYLIFFIALWFKVRGSKRNSPAFTALMFIIVYITSHNKELTQFFAFSIMGSLIAELKYHSADYKEVEEEKEEDSQPALS